MISVVIPTYNERENIKPLVEEIEGVFAALRKDFEIIIVDDGSLDGTADKIRELVSERPNVTALFFSRNFGQSAAFAAGLSESRGEIVVTIDGDLENDPSDIPRLLSMLEQGFDVVSGWRKGRWDNQSLRRKIPSRVANWLISRISGVQLNDFGCMLKAYKRNSLDGIILYGEMHRFIPIYAYAGGAKIAEIQVNHRGRTYGKSKYGIGRTFKVVLDLLFVKFLTRYMNRPIHFFGGLGLLAFGLGVLAAFAAVALRVLEIRTFVSTPLPVFSAMFLIVGVQLMVMGILAEIVMRTYYESQKKTSYKIRERITSL